MLTWTFCGKCLVETLRRSGNVAQHESVVLDRIDNVNRSNAIENEKKIGTKNAYRYRVIDIESREIPTRSKPENDFIDLKFDRTEAVFSNAFVAYARKYTRARHYDYDGYSRICQRTREREKYAKNI